MGERWYLAFLVWGMPVMAWAQRQIQGQLLSEDEQPIAYANVIVKKEAQILTFKMSDQEGYFAILLTDSLDLKALHLEVRHLGYKTLEVPLSRSNQVYKLHLQEQVVDLSQVEVKSRPKLVQRGDTLFYEVQSFAQREDRSIGDVLRRMPGIEVGEDGEIKYNGKSISHFYIDGDDLLGDRYALGSRTIPQGMVKGVEVLQRHQPIRVLRNRVSSEEVALNLVIKDDAKLKMTGQTKLGMGLPAQYDEELNNILFNKKVKMLNVLKANNIGEDLSADFNSFNGSSFLSSLGNDQPGALLALGTAGNPALPKNRYYRNQSGSLNLNDLLNLKKGWQIKSNAHLWLDRNGKDYSSLNELYLAADTVRYQEEQAQKNTPFLMDLDWTAELNQPTAFFKDELKISYAGNSSQSILTTNGMEIRQSLHDRISDFSNYIQYVPKLKQDHLIEATWYLNYYQHPQSLLIYPGINAALLNEGEEYDESRQQGTIPSWFNRMFFSYGLMKGRIKQHYRIGMLNEWQELRSALRLLQDDGRETLSHVSEDNRLHWNRHRLYVEPAYEFKNDDWELSWSTPLSWQHIGYQDRSFLLDTGRRQWLFNPSLRARYQLDAEHHLETSYAYLNQIGKINDIYRGAILVNYRSLQTNAAPLREQNTHQANFSFHFQRSISMLFAHVGLQWNRSTANSIVSSQVNQAISQTVLVPLKNNVSTFSLETGVSKYLFGPGATVAFKASWSDTRFNQLLNGTLFPYSNRSMVLHPSIETRLWKVLSLSYQGTGTWMKSKLAGDVENLSGLTEQSIFSLDQSAELTGTLFKQIFITVNTRQLLTAQAQTLPIHYWFVDARARWRIDRWRSDLSFQVSNLTNVKDYLTYSISANSFWNSHYVLRGRMALFTYTFTW